MGFTVNSETVKKVTVSKNIKQTAVINIVRLRILTELNVSYDQQHTFSKVTVTKF